MEMRCQPDVVRYKIPKTSHQPRRALLRLGLRRSLHNHQGEPERQIAHRICGREPRHMVQLHHLHRLTKQRPPNVQRHSFARRDTPHIEPKP